MAWHYECNGQSVGPVSEEAVKLLIRDRVLVRSTLVWKARMSGWSRADETDLLRYFDTPPLLAPLVKDLRGLTDDPSRNPKPTTERGVAETEFSGGYAETNSDASGAAISPPPTPDPAPMPYRENPDSIKPLRGMVSHAQIAVIAFVTAAVVAIVSDFMSIDFLSRALSGGFQSDAELNRQALVVDAFSQYAAIAFLIVFAWSAVVIARWTYRAMKNLRVMGYETTVTPAWAVGWHFIPVALLWMPFRGVAQIWRGSIDGAPTGKSRLPVSMRLWWASWLLGNWSSYGAAQMQDTGLRIEDFELVQVSMGVGIVGSGLLVVSALLLLGLMKQVTRAQGDQPAEHFS